MAARARRRRKKPSLDPIQPKKVIAGSQTLDERIAEMKKGLASQGFYRTTRQTTCPHWDSFGRLEPGETIVCWRAGDKQE